jgi:hypothetical protein
MPVRFLSPSLGGSNGPLLAGHWALGLAYRHLGADQWFVGTNMHEAAAPFGHPLFLTLDSLDASVSHGVSDRVSLTLTTCRTASGAATLLQRSNPSVLQKPFVLLDQRFSRGEWLERQSSHCLAFA